MNYTGILTFLDSNEYLYLLSQTQQQISDVFGQEFAMEWHYSQNNPHHCYSLLEHTLQTLIALDCMGLSSLERRELQIAALYHDVGKPSVAFEKKGKTVFYNHAKISKEIVEKELKAFGVDAHTIDKICFFVEYHDMFISFKLNEEMTSRANSYIKEITPITVKKTIDKVILEFEKVGGYVPSHHDFKVLLQLCRADALAQSVIVVENGKVIDTKENKLKRLLKISEIIENI